MKLLKLLTLLSLLLSSYAYSADETVYGKVVYAGTYGNGDVYVDIEAIINEPGCVGTRLDVSSQNPNIKNILPIAYMAMATGQNISVRTQGCYAGSPTLDNSRGSWFYLIHK